FREVERAPRLAGDLFEFAVAEIAQQQLLLIVGKGLIAMSLLPDDRSIDGQRIEPAIVVEIEPGRSPSGVRQAESAKTRLRARVTKRAVPVVQIQVRTLAGQLGHDQVV